jgi:transposase
MGVGREAMNYVEGESREQRVLFPEALDEYITEDNVVRFIDAFVEGLEMEELGFNRSAPKETGRPPYDPRDLLKLYIYGYVNRIRTGRTLERECHRNVELMWLMRKLGPDFKTITDFRKDNRGAFTGVFRQFVLVCKGLGLLGGEWVAVDGSKFKAVNSGERNFTRKKLERRLKELDGKVERYLDEMDRSDPREEDPPLDKEALKQKIAKLKERKGRYEELIKELNSSGQSQVSLTDPDSRAMALTPRGEVSYNVQTAVDSKYHLIVAEDVSNEGLDNHQLFSMAQGAKEILGRRQIDVVADMGYDSHEEFKNCELAGINVYVAKPLNSKNTAHGLLGKERFIYEPESDSYICPSGERLTFRFQSREKKNKKFRYYWTLACRSCPIKAQCTTNKQFRRIKRWEHEAIAERVQQRVLANSRVMKLRQQIVEHPFGTIKFWNDQRHFLMKGLAKVRAEFSLSTLAYNLKRVVNIVGVKGLLTALP